MIISKYQNLLIVSNENNITIHGELIQCMKIYVYQFQILCLCSRNYFFWLVNFVNWSIDTTTYVLELRLKFPKIQTIISPNKDTWRIMNSIQSVSLLKSSTPNKMDSGNTIMVVLSNYKLNLKSLTIENCSRRPFSFFFCHNRIIASWNEWHLQFLIQFYPLYHCSIL